MFPSRRPTIAFSTQNLLAHNVVFCSAEQMLPFRLRNGDSIRDDWHCLPDSSFLSEQTRSIRASISATIKSQSKNSCYVFSFLSQVCLFWLFKIAFNGVDEACRIVNYVCCINIGFQLRQCSGDNGQTSCKILCEFCGKRMIRKLIEAIRDHPNTEVFQPVGQIGVCHGPDKIDVGNLLSGSKSTL